MNWAMLALSIVIQLLFPILLGFLLIKKLGLSWRIFLVGVLFFVISQLMEIPIAAGLIGVDLGLKGKPILGALIAGLTAGIFEELSRYLGLRFNRTMTKNRTWSGALLYGAGHGGAESILIGLGIIALIIFSLFLPDLLPPELIVDGTGTWYAYLFSGLERIFAIALHISLAVLVLQVFVRKRISFLFLAMFYHALVDFTALSLQATFENLLLTEGVVLIFALISLGIIWYFRVDGSDLSSQSLLVDESLFPDKV